jgi:hypothetical protein
LDKREQRKVHECQGIHLTIHSIAAAGFTPNCSKRMDGADGFDDRHVNEQNEPMN